MNLYKFKSIRTRLTYWILLFSLIPLLIAMTITYIQRVNDIEEKAIDKLSAIRDLKVQQVESWLENRLGDVHVMAGDFEIRALEGVFGEETKSSSDFEKIEIANELLNRNLRNYIDYEEIFIIDSNTGIIELSTNQQFIGENKSNNLYFTRPLETGEVYIKDIYYSNSRKHPSMTISTPIYCMEHNTHIIGVLVARINLDKSLYNLLLNRTGLGETGETLLVDKNALALNALRWHYNAPLNLKISSEPTSNAAIGKTGVIISSDYRDEEVLAAYTYIAKTGWGFVCKQDKSELNAPIRKMALNFIFLFGLIAIIVFFISLYSSNSISKPILNMNRVSQKMKAGDYSVRNSISSDDELGALAQALNNMADAIESRIKIQKGVAAISQKMISLATMYNFGSEILKQLLEITFANSGVFYILNEATSEYEHFASVGVNKELLLPFSAENAEGEIGNAISKKNIYYLHDISEDTIFKYRTFAGEIIPKEIITIPILVENSVVAIISLASIHKFGTECHDIIKNSWANINTSYSNLIAGERTTVLAEYLSNTNQRLEAQTEELQEQAEEMQDQAEELQRTSEELQEQNLEFEAQRNQVESVNKLKSEFLSNMSHELRTPLNSIMALSRVLIMEAKDKLNEDENSYLEIVERNGKKLLALINDILDLSKIEAGKMEILPSFISLSTLLQIIKENLHSISKEKGLPLNLNLPDDLPKIETDESKLYQVLTNIVGNALKFTEKGSVDVSVKHDSKNVFIEVKDTGIGISQEVLPHIFDEFRQADGTTSRQFQGTGLGLAIAKKITTILGGIIKVKSQLNKGSVFTVALPVKWHEVILISQTENFKTRKLKSDKKTILVVDDDSKMAKNISKYLHDVGYKTITTSSGKKALKLAEKYKPAAITLDLVMPDMDGWEVLQKLKNNKKTKDIPVIIVSVSDERDTGYALGAIGYVNKPVDKKILLSEIYTLHRSPDSVMIVDDNEFEQNQIAETLKAVKIDTIVASGGEECIRLLEDKIPDLLILDLMMPGMDGFQVLDKIRKVPETKNLPVIVVTAKDLTTEDKSKLSGKISAVIAKSDSTQNDLFHELKRIIAEIEKTGETDNSDNRILIVEDNYDAIVQIKAVLENENYKVDVAGGGQEALDYIEHKIPSGIILDLMMPDVDGFEVLEKIRSTKRTKNIPVLILTAKDLNKNDLAKLSSNNIQQLIHKGDVDIKEILNKVKLMLENQPETSNPKPETRNLKPNILVVEDNPDNMTTIKAIVKNNFSITEALDGEEGLKLAKTRIPDLILLDMSLPKLSGEEVIKKLRKNLITKNIPVIAVTALAMKGDEKRFLKAGCNGYISKPIDSDSLLAEIERLLRR